MKKIGYNNWLINQQKENRLKRYKKITLFRRYWDSGNKEYTWESKANISIDQDIIKCGKVTWKADTDQLNIWKMGNISLIVDNIHGKWDVENSSGYFNGYVAFLSTIRIEVGFIAQDKTIYEIFSYQGLIAADGIQLDNEKHEAKIKVIALDYLIQSVNAENVSKEPVDPVLKYYDVNIYSSTTIGKTGSGWGTNSYQYKIVRIIGGTGIGQERSILSNTADTLTVNTWETTPDATSDFKITGEYMGIGNASQVEWVTIQPGVGKIMGVWIDDDIREQGNHYDISQLNESTLGAKITFKTPPGSGVRIATNYIYWYQSQTFKFLIEKILNLAKVANRYIQDVSFPTQVEMQWLQTSQADWQAGIAEKSNLVRYPGDIIADDDTGTSVKAYDMGYEPEQWSIESTRAFTGLGGTPSYWHAHKFKCTKSAYISYLSLRFGAGDLVPDGGVECVIRNWVNDSDPEAGTVFASATNTPSVPVGAGTTIAFYFNNVRLVYGDYYWILTRRTIMQPLYGEIWTIYRLYREGTDNPDKKFGYQTQSGWSVFYYAFAIHLHYYHPYYNFASHMSQSYDTGVALTSYGKIEIYETLNNGESAYFTRTQDADSGWPASWTPGDWQQVDAFRNITSPVRRYIKVAVYFAPDNPGGESTSDDINTPFIHSYIIKYYVSEYKPSLANFINKNGKSAIEVIAKLANYEMGFFTDFDDSANMVWDKEYDGDVMPQTEGWTENKTGTGAGSISSGELFINGTSGHCFYDIVDTNLDPRRGWTVEANIEKTSGSDENFQIIINDGTFHTRVAITNLGYLKLMQYDKDDLTKSKQVVFPVGNRYNIKIARKGTMIKIYVNNKVALMSYANNVNSNQKIYFGQIEDTSTTYQAVINWLKYSNSIPCFETFYLPKYYFQDRESIVDSNLQLGADTNYIKLYNFKNGWDRVYNHIKADYGEYSYYANPETELDDSPNSEDKYGKRMLTISGEDFLQAEDTNVSIGTAKVYYAYYKNPKRRFKLLCRYLFQLNLSNKIYVSCAKPFILNSLPCKVVGIVLDVDNFTLDLDCEEII